MAQGGFKSSTAKGKGGKPPPKKAATGKSAPVKAKAGLGRVGGKHGMKKGSFVVAPKQADALKAHKKAEVITKAINKQLITQCAAKAVQNQEKMSMRDIRGSGKALAKDMRRAALTRKKSRVEEKLIEARSKLDHLDQLSETKKKNNKN